VVAIEHGFVGRNPHTALVMGETLGTILMAVQSHKTPNYPGPKIIEYAPKEIKLAVTGHGNASKELVRDMIISILQWPISEMRLTYDESDALAVALACAMREN
jgi:crossover junction endodeoxyribonuclease RuvC